MLKRLALTSLLVALVMSFRSTLAQEACPLAPRLNVGDQGRRRYDDSNNLRNMPGLNGGRVGVLPPGAIFTVVAGPECVDGYHWWQVDVGGVLGWTAEGHPGTDEYWLEPRGTVRTQIGEDGIERAFIVTEDGGTEREGCLLPPNDSSRVFIGYAQLNTRTLAMLDHATILYQAQGGTRDFRQALSQGSYTGGSVTASFGTHDAGGAVDISVRSPVDWSVMGDEIPRMIDALRVAGFAAWLRAEDQLYDGSVIHIHAVAVGDAELSQAARAQIDGPYGYLRGYNGLPPEWGGPGLDEHGDPVICRWMVARGFEDMRPENAG